MDGRSWNLVLRSVQDFSESSVFFQPPKVRGSPASYILRDLCYHSQAVQWVKEMFLLLNNKVVSYGRTIDN